MRSLSVVGVVVGIFVSALFVCDSSYVDLDQGTPSAVSSLRLFL